MKPKNKRIASKKRVPPLARGSDSSDRMAKLEKALQLHLDFLASLPNGWLGKTCGDVGLLNDAYIASRELGMKIA